MEKNKFFLRILLSAIALWIIFGWGISYAINSCRDSKTFKVNFWFMNIINQQESNPITQEDYTQDFYPTMRCMDSYYSFVGFPLPFYQIGYIGSDWKQFIVSNLINLLFYLLLILLVFSFAKVFIKIRSRGDKFFS